MTKVCLVTVVRAADCRTETEIWGAVIFRIDYHLAIKSLLNVLLSGILELMRLALII